VDVAVVGAGRAGTAVAVILERAGHRIVAASGRDSTRERVARYLPGVPVVDAAEAARAADLVLVAVPDDDIPSVVERLATERTLRTGAWVAHLAGALGLDVLGPARRAGARRLAIHPLQTFPDVDAGLERLPGCTVAVTADDRDGAALGSSLARDLGAVPFALPDEQRPLYHAAAVFASNHLVVTSVTAAQLFAAAGVPDPAAAMHPLQVASLDNVVRLGPEEALTGPAVRGDAGTVARNLDALAASQPAAVPVYVAMARLALDIGSRTGRLRAPQRAAVEEVLARWS
jgi:predicted short-subunit dehydrogenase-like oxidoreductase (DUF2520 family)